MIPSDSTGRIYISMLPVECHRVATLVTGDLIHIQCYLQFVIGLDTNISGNRILRDIAMEHAVHESRLEGSNIEVTISSLLDSLVDQFAQRFSSFMVTAGFIDCTFTNRHLAIHLVLEGKGTLDGSLTIQFVRQRSVCGINVVVLDIRDTYHEPVLLVITRNHIFYIRYKQFSFCLVRIHCLSSVRTIEFGSEIKRIGSTNADIELYVTEAINSLSRYIMRLTLTFQNRTLAVVCQTVFLQHVDVGEQAFVNCYVYLSITCTCVLGNDAKYFVIEVLVFFQIRCIQFVPHHGVRRLSVFLTQADRKRFFARVSGECFHKFSLELEVT